MFGCREEMVPDSSDSRSSSSSAASPEISMAAIAPATAEEELEAAEALADLALLAMREGSGGFQCRRASKRVKSESPPPNEVAESSTRCSELSPERKESHQQCGEAFLNPVEVDRHSCEKSFKLEDTSLVGSADCPNLGFGKSRRNLTEEEKEARRIRRILANRESARQTIRRRQALCEELTKKAADLSSENDNLRRDMEIALKEYQMYETTNKELKDQMEKLAKPAVSQASHFIPYNHPNFTPFFWPSVSQPNNIPFPVDHCDQESQPNTNAPMTPYYIFPYPWFFAHPDHGTAVQSQPSDPQMYEQELRPEPCEPHEMRITEDLNELPTELSPEKDDRGRAASPENSMEKGLQKDSGQQTGDSMDVSRSSPEKHERLAAAEARKRRKELTKMKNLHGRHCRMNN